MITPIEGQHLLLKIGVKSRASSGLVDHGVVYSLGRYVKEKFPSETDWLPAPNGGYIQVLDEFCWDQLTLIDMIGFTESDQ